MKHFRKVCAVLLAVLMVAVILPSTGLLSNEATPAVEAAEAGVIVISMVYTKNKGKKPAILWEPEITTRGFIFEKDYEHIIVEIKEKVAAICTEERLRDGSLHDLRNQVRSAVGKLVLERTGRRPVIMAALNEV